MFMLYLKLIQMFFFIVVGNLTSARALHWVLYNSNSWVYAFRADEFTRPVYVESKVGSYLADLSGLFVTHSCMFMVESMSICYNAMF